jgi:hypothetical protein
MTGYRRNFIAGGCFFFTIKPVVVTVPTNSSAHNEASAGRAGNEVATI